MVDIQLTDRVQSALDRNPHLPRNHFHMEARQGRVILRGKVKSFFHKQMAQESLRRIEGVDAIENHLEVDWNLNAVATA